MSELLAKHPEAILQALQGAGACGPGTPSKDLATCPAERYCALPGGGELCVYGLPEIGRMTQISKDELSASLVVPSPAASPEAPPAREITGTEVLAVALVFVAGIAVGRKWAKTLANTSPPGNT